MNVNSKHLATFMLGAAAGVAAYKYMSMSEEEKEALLEKLKTQAGELKTEAESTVEKATDYFEELASKGSDKLKDYMADAEAMLRQLMNKENPSATTPPTAAAGDDEEPAVVI